MSIDKTDPISVHILNKEYRIGCEAGQEEALRNAARLLDNRMKEIRRGGKVIGTDRIAVMVALNLAHELLTKQSIGEANNGAANRRLGALRERIELALNDTLPSEL